MNKPILQLKNIVKKFDNNEILKGVSLELYRGETHQIVGENGAGKSTLMKVISGVYSPDGGEIYWDGEKVEISSPYLAHKLGITTIYQEPNLFPNLSITENLSIHKFRNKFKFLSLKKLHHNTRELLKKYNLDIDPQTPVSELGLAQKQMVEIIRAVIRESKVIIFDEATAALSDPEFEIIRSLIKNISNTGVGIFFVSQRLDYLSKIGERVSVIRDGELIDTAYINQRTQQGLLEEMAGESYSDRYPKINVAKGKEILTVNHLSSMNILRDININIFEGEIVGLYGTMGSGRTLLGKTLFGLIPFAEGEILIQGVKISEYNHHKTIEHGFCYVPEDRKNLGLFLHLDVLTNITITQLDRFSQYGLLDKKKEIEVVDGYLKELAIKPRNPRIKVEKLSGGNQQKLILAKWFNMGANFFILDEPTRGIDTASKSDVYNIINKLVLSGSTILMISSDLNELVGMCDRIMVMKKGSIIGDIPREEASVNKILDLACN